MLGTSSTGGGIIRVATLVSESSEVPSPPPFSSSDDNEGIFSTGILSISSSQHFRVLETESYYNILEKCT